MISVLVVEDEALVGFNLQRQLQRAGYEVPAVAASADEALSELSAHSPDVVVMDIHIQGPRDGIQVAEEMRKTSHTPVIFVTALSDKLTLERARKTWPSGYLVKPISLASLISSIEIAMDRREIDRVGPSPAMATVNNNSQSLAEEKLSLVRNTLQASVAPLALLDWEGHIIFANDPLHSLLGYARDTLKGHIERLKPQDDKAAQQLDTGAILAASLTKPRALGNNWSVLRSDGARIRVEIFVAPLTVGNERFVVLSLADQSKYHDRGAMSQMFESLVDGVKDYAIFMMNPEGIILTWNKGAERIKGYAAEEIIGKHFSCFYTPEDIRREHPQEELRHALAQGKFAEEGWRVRSDGSRFLASVVITPIYDKDNRHVGFSKVTHDVTERKAAFDALRKSEGELRLMADTIPQIVWMARADGRTFYNNRRWYEFSGFEPPIERTEFSSNDSWLSLVDPDQRDRARESWSAAVVSKRPFEGEFKLFDYKRQNYRWHLVRALPVPAENHEIGRWFGTLTDVHERHEAAEALEAEVQKRTAALSDLVEQLQSKEENLRQSLAEKDVLLHEIHHRVKNNLQIISSLLNMQASNASNGETVSHLRDSERRVMSMALIHEHLYSNAAMSSIDFADYISKLVPLVVASHAAGGDSIAFRLDIQPTVLTIEQAIPCGLIFNELLTNALKYAYPDGQNGEILLALHSDANTVEMRLADRGIGLPADFDSPAKHTLGLQIVKILTKQLLGTLEVHNSGGADFTVRFPRRQEVLRQRLI